MDQAYRGERARDRKLRRDEQERGRFPGKSGITENERRTQGDVDYVTKAATTRMVSSQVRTESTTTRNTAAPAEENITRPDTTGAMSQST
eukprot:6462899-Amphidinium_carterae.1